MATEVRWRRGTTAENDNFTGAEGEITVDIDQKTIRVHDGYTQGGSVVPKDDDLGTAAYEDTGTGTDEVPKNSDLGTASLADTGTGTDEVPKNSDLGTASLADTGTGDDEVPTNAEFGGPTPAELGKGAIVESDTNDNGFYVRWENGEQVCWRTEGFANDIVDIGFDFPAEFIDNPTPGCNGHASTTNDSRLENAHAQTARSTGHSWHVLSSSNYAGDGSNDVFVGLTAWGFWK